MKAILSTRKHDLLARQGLLLHGLLQFLVMKERRIKAALTNDRHFVQAGFQVYPHLER